MIDVQCHTCGKPWEPERSDYVRGLWRTCPACRPGGAVARDTRDAFPVRAGTLGFDGMPGAKGDSGDALDLASPTPPVRAGDQGGST